MSNLDDTPVPSRLGGAVRRELRGRGLLRAPVHVRLARAATTVGVAALLVAIGAYAGSRRSEPTSAMPTFLLLLYEDSSFQQSDSHVAEYGRWAVSLAESDALVLAEKLGDSGQRLEPDGSAHEERAPEGSGLVGPTGFFLIRATDLGAAVALARQSPHLRYGGRIVVRPIEPT